jgi:three-Cys-motif partner protein
MFIDMFGGLGMWADKFTGEVCAGSPLCIYNTLEEENINYRGIVFEKDSSRAQDLTDILYNKRDNITVYNRDNRECLPTIREMEDESNPIQPALLYFDYTRQADSDHIKSLCRQFPQSDVLIHYSSTAFKRAINCGKCDKAKAHKGNAQYLTYLFGRRYWYINNWDELPHNKFNFVSIYGTNVRSASILPEYGGFDNILHPYDSQRGHELRRKAELTNKEIKEQYG